MLILIVQTPQIKKFWKELDEEFVENYENWKTLVDEMLAAIGLHPIMPPQSNVEANSHHRSLQSYLDEISDFESNSADVEIDNAIVERKMKEKEEEKMKMNKIKEEIENAKEKKRKLYEEIKRNYGNLMQIIEVKILLC